MDLISEFDPASSKGNRYALTAICMLTGFTFCIPLKSKKAEDVVTAYLNHICCVLGPSKKILTDNGKEFKNKMWDEVFKQLKMEHRVTPIYHHSVTDALKDFTSSSKLASESKFSKDLNGMILFGKPQQLTISFPQNPQVSHHSFSCMDVKQMPNT